MLARFIGLLLILVGIGMILVGGLCGMMFFKHGSRDASVVVISAIPVVLGILVAIGGAALLKEPPPLMEDAEMTPGLIRVNKVKNKGAAPSIEPDSK